MTDTAPAGWYDNPSGEGNLRYWSGAEWTDHFRDKPELDTALPATREPPSSSVTDREPRSLERPGTGSSSTTATSAVNDGGVGPRLVAKGHNGTVVFDGDFVTIIRKGALARLTVGKGDKRIPVGSITAVQWKQPGSMINGFISFTVGGGNERRSTFGSQTRTAVSDENSVVLMKKHVADFEKLRVAVERVIAERARPRTTQVADPVAQLAQLAELHRSGVLTDEEFAAKKASLLERF